MIKELKKQAIAKRKELRETQAEVQKSNDLEKVKELGEKIEKIIAELEDLEAQILDLEPEQEPAPEEGRSFDPLKSYFPPHQTSSEGGFLARNESFSSRFNCTRQGLDLGKYVKGLITGNWEGATEERNAFTTGAMGAIIPAEIAGKLIDQARNKSLFAQAGSPIYPMHTKKLTLGRVAGDPSFSFKGEGEKGAEASFNIEPVELEAKTAYGYAYVTLEAIHSTKNLSQLLSEVFAAAIANCIDRGILYGQDTDPDHAPAGVAKDTNINIITAENKRYDDFIKGIGAVRKNNGTPSVMAINADTEEILSLQYDDNNVYREPPEAVKKLNCIVSNQLKHAETGENDALIFDPSAVAIGLMKDITINIVKDTDKCIQEGLIGFQIYAMIDAKALQPKHISLIKNYTGVAQAS